jgi:aspartyl/glutamyl-tRNA(Asn/Gln) amidotransferase C subunit
MQGRIDIDRLALLARIKLAPREKEKFEEEFKRILDFVSQLEKAKTGENDKEEEIAGPETKNITREDEKILKSASIIQKDPIKVKHVLK